MEKDFAKAFDSCPNCGSNLRFCEQLGQELKIRDLARPDWTFAYNVRSGVVVEDKVTQTRILSGSSLPGFVIHTDICMGCGTIYATRLARLEMTPTPPKQHVIKPPGFGSPSTN